MPNWFIRSEHDPKGRALDSPQRVLEGLRDGDWDPGDEVRGPGERDWTPIEDHPAFADAVAEMGPPPTEHPDETRLDMNPLIDVSLVLLIFFILTTSYASLKRIIDLPETPNEGHAAKPVPVNEIKDRVIRLNATLDQNGKPVIKLNDRAVSIDSLESEIREQIKATGKKEVLATITDDVSWDVVSKIHDAAKGAGIRQIYWPKKK
jgi:biopolymer transport protein ExbD